MSNKRRHIKKRLRSAERTTAEDTRRPIRDVRQDLSREMSRSLLATSQLPTPVNVNSASDTPPTRGKRWARLHNKVAADPSAALRDARCLKEAFLLPFFDLCEGKVLEASGDARQHVEVARQLGERSGDPHLRNRAVGVTIHADVNTGHWLDAAATLRDLLPDAWGCCKTCASDWLRHAADLLVESRDAELSRKFLDLSARILGEDLEDDTRGRMLFVRGIAHHYSHERSAALRDAGDTLKLLSLASPHGYYLDTLAFLCCFLQGNDEPRHAETALAHLEDFRERLKGLKEWHDVRCRLRWVEGQIHDQLGHTKLARRHLEQARRNYLRSAPHHWVVAVATDEALVYARHYHDANSRAIRRILAWCKQQLRLEPELHRRFRRLVKDFGRMPDHAEPLLARFRRSYIAPVPGLRATLVCRSVLGG